MSLISLKSDKVDFFLRNPARLNFEGGNVKEDVDENRKNFGYLILDPNRTPIQMCLALARKSRKTGHPNGGSPFFSFERFQKCKIRGLFIPRIIFPASRKGSSFFLHSVGGGRHFFSSFNRGGRHFFFQNLPKKM